MEKTFITFFTPVRHTTWLDIKIRKWQEVAEILLCNVEIIAFVTPGTVREASARIGHLLKSSILLGVSKKLLPVVQQQSMFGRFVKELKLCEAHIHILHLM
jgi:hypothetical protein